VHVYTNGGVKCQRISQAFAQGAGATLAPASGGIRPGSVACYGMLRGLLGILDTARAQGREWYYLDNAYFSFGRFFRVTRGALQLTGRQVEPHGLSRMRVHDLPWRDWQADGSHILIAQQTPAWYGLIGEGSREDWTQRTVDELKRHTDRPIRLRPKDCDRSLLTDLNDCWAVVTHSSNVAIEAIVRGVPAFVTGQSAAAPVALSDLSRIESPLRYEDRLHWAARLAANQWTMDEMRDGTCWRDLNVQKAAAA